LAALKKRNIVFIVLIAAMVISLIAIGFTSHGVTPAGMAKITFEELISNPAAYNGKTVEMDAFVFTGFEVNVLCAELELSGLSPGHLVPRGVPVWIEGGIPAEVYRSLYYQEMQGPLERFGKVHVTGRFQYGGKYGHLASYDYSIIPRQMSLLAWSPQ
jgi:hypothetical protein